MKYPQYPLLSGALISSVTGLLHTRIMTPNIKEFWSLSKPPNYGQNLLAEDRSFVEYNSASKENAALGCQIVSSKTRFILNRGGLKDRFDCI